jgi:flagellar basal body-associated protein FliL
MNHQLHTEPNIYYQHQFTAGAIASRNASSISHNHQSSRSGSSEESSGTQQNNTSNNIDEQAIIKKQLKKIKMSLVIAVTTITVFLVALAMISSVLLASRRDCQAQQPLLPDTAEKFTKQMADLTGNLSALKNQIVVDSDQLNEYAHQIQTLNSITETINSELTEYTLRTRSVERSVNRNEETIGKMNNNSASKSTVLF